MILCSFFSIFFFLSSLSRETIGIIAGSVVGGVVIIGAVAGSIVWYMKAHALASTAVFASGGGGAAVGGAMSIIPDIKVSNNNLNPPPTYSDATGSVAQSQRRPAIRNHPQIVKSDSHLSATADIDFSIEDDDSIMTAL